MTSHTCNGFRKTAAYLSCILNSWATVSKEGDICDICDTCTAPCKELDIIKLLTNDESK